MPRRLVSAEALQYTIADDDPLPAGMAWWAVLRARVIDELTLAPPRTPIRLTSNLVAATPRVGDGGYCGLVARPRDVAHALLTPGALAAAVEAPGFLPRDLTPAVDAARRALNTAAAVGDPAFDVLPPDGVPPQFRPGRGVLVARPAPAGADEFNAVGASASPPPPGQVPLADPVGAPHALNTRVAGVPLVLPDQHLHRAEPVRLRGRAQRRTGPTSIVPALGAQIGIAGIWLAYPHTQTQAPVAPDFCAIAPGLRFPHPVGAPIQRGTFNAAGAPRGLRQFAPAGARAIVVAPNLGLNPAGGDLLRLGDPLASEDEIVVSAGFDAVGDPNAPVTLRLTAPTAHLHRAPGVVRDIAPAALVAAGAVARETLPGDRVLFAAGIGALPTASMLAVEHGAARAAYYHATQYPSHSGGAFFHQLPFDAEGRFVSPPLARVAQLRVIASHPLHPAQQLDVALDYGGDNVLAIVFS